MSRRVCTLLLGASFSGLVAASCGTVESDADPDGRPLEFEYIVGAIFAPSCGQTQCHSKFKQAGGLVFDNPDDARLSLLTPNSGPLLQFDANKYDPEPIDPGPTNRPNLIRWLTEKFPMAEIEQDPEANSRMPFDAPLPAADIELLQIWIRKAPESAGDPPGATAKGAQCNPALYGGRACNFNDRVVCAADFSFGEPLETCEVGCQITDLCVIDEMPCSARQVDDLCVVDLDPDPVTRVPPPCPGRFVRGADCIQ